MAEAFAISAIMESAGNFLQGIQEIHQAKLNAQIYEAQARNIETQKSILAGQYRTKAEVLEGNAIAKAGRSGVKVTGSTALSISQNLEQLMLDESYQQYNLSVQKQKALDNAKYERYKAKTSFIKSWWGGSSTLLMAGKNYADKYWKNDTSNLPMGGDFDINNISEFRL